MSHELRANISSDSVSVSPMIFWYYNKFCQNFPLSHLGSKPPPIPVRPAWASSEKLPSSENLPRKMAVRKNWRLFMFWLHRGGNKTTIFSLISKSCIPVRNGKVRRLRPRTHHCGRQRHFSWIKSEMRNSHCESLDPHRQLYRLQITTFRREILSRSTSRACWLWIRKGIESDL